MERQGGAPVEAHWNALHRDALRRIAISAWVAPMNRVMAMSLLDDPDLVTRTLGGNPDPELLLAALQYAATGQIEFNDLDLIRTSTRDSRADLRLMAIQALSIVRPVA